MHRAEHHPVLRGEARVAVVELHPKQLAARADHSGALRGVLASHDAAAGRVR